MSKIKDITGQKFGKLTASSISHKADSVYYWNCVCDCGNEYIAKGTSLRFGSVKSCGCLQKKMVSKANKTHGKSRTKIHSIWKGMIGRCTQEKSVGYHLYGGRGIKVCDRWMKFENFYEDMGGAPEGKSLDRINNNGNYELKNCRWATLKEQANNTRKNVFLEFQGEKKTISQWAEYTGISRPTIQMRMRLNWSTEKVLTIKPRKNKKLNDICIAVIKHLHAEGVSINRLANAHNLNRHTISKAINI